MSTLRPSRLSKTLALVPPAMALMAQHASGAFDAFIKFGDNITGESLDEKHTGWIELKSVEWNVSRTITAGTSGSQRDVSAPKVSEITLTKDLDRASPAIFLNAVSSSTSTPIPTVTLELTKSTGMETPPGVFYRLTLSNVLVSSQKNTANNGDDRPRETITLNFTKIKVEYWTQDAKGTLTPVTPVQFDLTKGIAS